MTEAWWMFLMGGVFTVIVLGLAGLVALAAYHVAVWRRWLRVSSQTTEPPPRGMGIL